ncbi:group 1 truncated hemoglobin [Streptomyces sp. NPDC096040]|uniref:group I truncated hemoglobin n=1 Tax=Streptomyces sp. NPDC096040 TaxID=3155541 RepID=UPI003328F825
MTDITAGTPAPAATPTLFEQLGGEEAVGAVVLDRLKQHQRRFIGQALGTTRPYSGRSMRKAHEHLAVTEDAFGRVVTHLAGALTEAGVGEETIGTIAQTLLPLKEDIVTA